MAKSLLILSVVATQLLAGGGGSLYLCISDDGSYCCIDFGPDSCACCQPEERHSACADQCCSHNSDEPCSDHREGGGTPETPQPASLAAEPCGCTHVLISAEQPTSITRTCNPVETERLSQLAMLPSCLPNCQQWGVLPIPHARWHGPPAAPDLALAVISTVVIRC